MPEETKNIRPRRAPPEATKEINIKPQERNPKNQTEPPHHQIADWDQARDRDYTRRLRAKEPTTETEWDASYKWHLEQLQPPDTLPATLTEPKSALGTDAKNKHLATMINPCGQPYPNIETAKTDQRVFILSPQKGCFGKLLQRTGDHAIVQLEDTTTAKVKFQRLRAAY
jgi:hypothetical protein